MKNEALALRLRGLVIFRGLLEKPVLSRVLALLETPAGDVARGVTCYAELAAVLLERQNNLSAALLDEVLTDENWYVRCASQKGTMTASTERCLSEELRLLGAIGQLDGAAMRQEIGYDGYLPEWETTDYELETLYRERIAAIGAHGYGIFAQYYAFVLGEQGLEPVKYPDPVTLAHLPGYQRERKQVADNTLALLEGRPAANVLLYGDSGTGKSSTVKAVVNEYRTRGLRLIELKKNQLHRIPALLDQLGCNPLKFLLFIDDLSFACDDDNYAALKATLEGSVSSKTDNVAIYATSNRRHLVKENFADREGDELHFADTIAELTSLSDRFGLTVTFAKPDKKLYLQIVQELAKTNRIALTPTALTEQAEAFALRRSGRSPRVAKQFIESLL